MTAHAEHLTDAHSVDDDFEAEVSGVRPCLTVDEAEALVCEQQPEEAFDPLREARKRFSAAMVATIAASCAVLGMFTLGWLSRVVLVAAAVLVAGAAVRVRRGDLRVKERR